MSDKAQTLTVPAPIKGLNYKDSLATMGPKDALILDNIVCRNSALQVRPGWQNHVSGFVATVETLVSYAGPTGAKKLFACAGGSIYDVSSSGVVGAAVRSGFANAYWASVIVNNVAGNTLLMVNGTDTGQSYDGTTWSAWGITGVASTALDFVTTWKRRVWAIEKNTMRAWYLATDAVSGAATSFDFSAIFQRGGKLVALLSWTVDGGAGIDDKLIVVTSEGEFAVYEGTDPASASTFYLRGRYYIGRPVGRRFFCNVGGEPLLLTVSGVTPLSKFFLAQGDYSRSNFADRIQPRLAQDVATYGTSQGWEMLAYPEENLVFVQVPGGAIGNRYQYALNTLTGAWSRLFMAPVVTLTTHDGALYAGHATRVANQWTGGRDNTTAISYTILPAFSYFGSPTRGKQFLLSRVSVQSDQPPTMRTTLLSNFNTSYTPAALTAPALTGALWGTAKWGQAKWGGSTNLYQSWFSVAGYATTAALVLQGLSQGKTTSIIAIDYTFQVGGILG